MAHCLAQATGESCISISDCMNKNEFSFSLRENERVGFVTPVYFWGLPDIVVRFGQQAESHWFAPEFHLPCAYIRHDHRAGPLYDAGITERQRLVA